MPISDRARLSRNDALVLGTLYATFIGASLVRPSGSSYGCLTVHTVGDDYLSEARAATARAAVERIAHRLAAAVEDEGVWTRRSR